ncbi:17-beta-hydroxysteroid dehydrogenase type 6-like [Ixodes scapularis]|uniref:17-beta-hydroxysteroid dehydrogenase type 6-like n=1 Tax=Ixodes scapularis TaxID=6945 RepID=UPI001A9EA27C|nr:17-beta-hydroxysteroid dehydrogenase type 6-like [Ixodes scapularis]
MRTIKIATAHLFLLLTGPLWLVCARVPLLILCAQILGLLVLVTHISYWAVWILRRQVFVKLVSGDGKAVLITGCDTGFGHLLAKRLAKEGFYVFAGCLFSDGADAKELRSLPNVHVLQLDVTKEGQVELALEEVKKSLGSRVLWSVVANAGVPNHGPIEWQTMDRIRSVFDVNVFGTTLVAKRFLPLLRDSKGRLVIVSSGLGRVTFHQSTVYCMTKHAVISLADGLRRQYYERGVHVITIEPGAYRTKMLDTHELECILKADMKNLPADVQRSITQRNLTTFTCLVSGFLNGIARDDPNEVVHEMVLAVRETDPKAIYTAGNQMECLFRYIFGVVPTELTDAWLSLLGKFMIWGASLKQKRS